MASSAIRKPWYARATFWLLIIATWFIADALARVFGWWIWLLAGAFLGVVNSRNPGSRAKPTDLPTTPAPAAVTSEELAEIKKSKIDVSIVRESIFIDDSIYAIKLKLAANADDE